MENFETYQSPFSWRYGSQAMRQLWSERGRRALWRRIWIALATTQSEFGLVTPAQLEELASHAEDIDIPEALRIESVIHHDLMAELKVFSAQCPTGGGALHMGATSMDIEDNADALRLRGGLDLILDALRRLLQNLAARIEETAEIPVMAFTHLQPAEPSTLGYRFSMYAQDLLQDWRDLNTVRNGIRGKGFKGAVGTSAAYIDLIGAENLPRFESRLSGALDLEFFPVTSQTYPRRQDFIVLSGLAGLAASLHKFAFDLRLLQSSPISEISERFEKDQVGSSAMPFKRNPINAEKIDSLARLVAAAPQVAWQNAALSLLERTLDDSANRRSILPESFLACDEMLRVADRLVRELSIHLNSMQRSIARYAPFACTERVLTAACKKGAHRQEMHEHLRGHTLAAWQAVQSGQENPLLNLLQKDPEILRYLSADQIDELTQVSTYTGNAARAAAAMADEVRAALNASS